MWVVVFVRSAYENRDLASATRYALLAHAKDPSAYRIVEQRSYYIRRNVRFGTSRRPHGLPLSILVQRLTRPVPQYPIISLHIGLPLREGSAFESLQGAFGRCSPGLRKLTLEAHLYSSEKEVVPLISALASAKHRLDSLLIDCDLKWTEELATVVSSCVELRLASIFCEPGLQQSVVESCQFLRTLVVSDFPCVPLGQVLSSTTSLRSLSVAYRDASLFDRFLTGLEQNKSLLSLVWQYDPSPFTCDPISLRCFGM
jgi:hypothetical protein